MFTEPAKRENATHPWRDCADITWLAYLVLGVFFGITLTKSEVLSWFRIQEMFRFQSPRMYEIIASAVVVAAVSLALIRRLGVKTISGEPITIPPKSLGLGVRYAAGGTIFGLGWALGGVCPGPLFALVGNGVTVMVVAIGSALIGTWLYGFLRPRLPH
ncbi:MAG: YeeE/YedE family protein [Acidobacteriia bacterium]|nr:YeeE/YedE family protein [Terriglobia bacterium]